MDELAADGVAPWDEAAILVRAAQRGDAIALDDLLTLLVPYLTRLCRPIALTDTADAVQESLLAICRGLASLRDPQAIHAWARTLATREAVRLARRTARETPASPDQIVALEDLRTASNATELSIEVRDVLSGLDPRYRAVLVLKELEGLDEQAVAKLLDIPAGTVKSRLHRARGSFRKAWLR
jgi:RNA polymerase sigma-70 factor (ECF subfamily)